VRGLPWPSSRGRYSSIVNREDRSARVPVVELRSPRIRSPSQWPGGRPVISFGWAFTDHEFGSHEGLSPGLGAGPTHPERPARPQAGRQLSSKRAPALHIQRLVDGLMGDARGRVVWEVDGKPVGDLLGTPSRGPSTRLSPAMAAPLPADAWSSLGCTVGRRDQATKSVLHILTQSLVPGELRSLRTPCATVCMPLRRCSSIVEVPAAGGRIPPDLPGNR
jgi:hypothetical protein